MKRLLIPTFLSLIGLAVLLTLGTWQMNRHIWKQDLLANIRANQNAAPVAIADPKSFTFGSNASFRKTAVTGKLHLGRTQYVYALRDGQPGYLVFSPLETSENTFVYINRGFVSERNRSAFEANISTDIRDVKIIGYLRSREEGNWFTPPSSRKSRTWYVADIKNMAKAASLTMASVDFYLDADVNSTHSDSLKGRELGALVKSIPNNHFSYALTWYGLACALIGVFIAFAFSGRKEGK